MTQKIINVHTHLGTGDDLDARFRNWRENGCVRVCVQVTGDGRSPVDARGNRGIRNEEMVPLMKRHPDLLLGFALVDLGREPDRAEAVDRFRAQGFTGLKLIAPFYPYDDERYYHIYERAEALGMPVLFHTGHLVIRPTDRERGVSFEKMRAGRLDTIGRAFPGLRMMMAHLGNPEFEVGLSVTRKFANIYGEFSGSSGSKSRETALRRLFHPLPGTRMDDPQENLALTYFRKLCFSTDSPDPPGWIALSRRLMDELAIPPETRELFWWRNAARWLGIEGQV